MILAKFLNGSVSSVQQVICADADNWCTMFNVLLIIDLRATMFVAVAQIVVKLNLLCK